MLSRRLRWVEGWRVGWVEAQEKKSILMRLECARDVGQTSTSGPLIMPSFTHPSIVRTSPVTASSVEEQIARTKRSTSIDFKGMLLRSLCSLNMYIWVVAYHLGINQYIQRYPDRTRSSNPNFITELFNVNYVTCKNTIISQQKFTRLSTWVWPLTNITKPMCTFDKALRA